MFRLLRRLGEHVRRRDGRSELDQLAEDMGSDYKIGLAICFNPEGEFLDVELTQWTDDQPLYRFGNPRGNDYTLVSKTSSTTENVVPRLTRNAEKVVDWGTAEDATIQLLERCHATAEERDDEIVEAVLDKYPKDASRDKRVFAYWTVLDGDERHPFYETETVRNFLAEAVLDSYADRAAANVRMHEEEGVCSVCGDEDVPVYGNFSDITCYNVDKPGFITGGFDYGQTTRNFPICRSCILDVRGGKAYVEQHLDLYGAGLNYWLLPDAEDDRIYQELLDRIEDQPRQTLGREARNIMSSEDTILDVISYVLKDEDSHAPVTLNFIFYEASNAAWRIAGEIRRVLPSRVTELFEAKEWLETQADLPTFSSNEDEYQFSLARLQPFCGSFDSQDDRKLLRYLEAIFQGDSLRYRTLIGDLVQGILDAQKEALGEGGIASAQYRVRDAWAIHLFLDRIDAIQHPDRGDDMTIDFDEDTSYTRYIEGHEEFFQSPEKIAAFLTGCYVGQVMYAQYLENKDRDTQPFAKKFTGRKIDRSHLMRLHNEGRDKLTQYERGYLVQNLEPVFAEAWTRTGENWSIDDEEATFAFNIGWTLARNLATREEDDTETEPKQEASA